ncbi:MAG: DEAD/DEAH box helicase [bacterium]
MNQSKSAVNSITSFVEKLINSEKYRDQICYIHKTPFRQPCFCNPSRPLSSEVLKILEGSGIHSLYSHQAKAIDLVFDNQNVGVVTSTASGKTFCYNIPVLESLISDPSSCALYVFPTKALAQDQLRVLNSILSLSEKPGNLVKAGTYDGDTPADMRRRLRSEANIILTNPDMLHRAILPYHSRWSRFFTNLRYVVIDEMHTYRGIFGSNVANVIRRLRRIASHYSSKPVFILCSATIANPEELARDLIGEGCEIVSEDGSPHGSKIFLLWNPPIIDRATMQRKSSNVMAHELMTNLITEGIQTIAFTRARIVAELILRYVRESLSNKKPDLVERVKAYRAGYLPQERRKIEKDLAAGEIVGVASTNALELGIDIGGLDASLIVGFPGTIASVWQQAGRAGRKSSESLVILIAYNDPIDQYLIRNPRYIFERSPENAVVDPENPYILAGHLSCAAFELPLTEDDNKYFGSTAWTIVHVLEEARRVKLISDAAYWASNDFPAAQINLRTISDDTFTIVDRTEKERVIGVVDAVSAPELVYPQAIYMHDGDTYVVRELDMQARVAYVAREEVDYYTQPILDSSIRVMGEKRFLTWKRMRIYYGDATVTWRTTAFKKIQFYNLDSIGYGSVDIPSQVLETVSLWMHPTDEVIDKIRRDGRNPIEGMIGLKNVLINLMPLYVMCDRQDVGGIVESSNLGHPAIFLYDRFRGGLGLCEKAFALIPDLLVGALDLIEECRCDRGCPSCVGLPVLRPPQHQDPDPGQGYPIPDKITTRILIKSTIDV